MMFVDMPGASYRWFPGNHGDVGGGWAETDLSDVVLQWMHFKMALAGINLLPPQMLSSMGFLYHPDANAPIHKTSFCYYTYQKDETGNRATSYDDPWYPYADRRKSRDFFKLQVGVDYFVPISDSTKVPGGFAPSAFTSSVSLSVSAFGGGW